MMFGINFSESSLPMDSNMGDKGYFKKLTLVQ